MYSPVMKMNGLVERYMDEETIRIFCFFLRNKYNPKDPVCKGCARKNLCGRDAEKMLSFAGYIPWWEEDPTLSELLEKSQGHQRCKNCELI